MKWNPQSDFFQKNSEEDIAWELKVFTEPGFPLNLVECKMKGLGETSFGYSADCIYDIAVKKSFAEAWERLWFSSRNKARKALSTSGFAAGADSAMAIKNAKQELVERAVLLKAWQSQNGWRRRKFSTFKSKYINFALFLKAWNLKLYDLHSSEGTVKCLVAQHPTFGIIFDSTFSEDNKISEEKLLNSVMKNIFLPNLEKIEVLQAVAEPLDHAKFYSNPNNSKAFDFLNYQDKIQTEFILENPESLQYEVLCEAGIFPAVAVCDHPTWPKISWGKNSIQGKNRWPHPLA